MPQQKAAQPKAAQPKTRKVYDPETRREEIIKAAFLCLSEEGYAKLSARKVAARAEMALGHISYHFKDMNELLVEAYKYASHQLYEATRAGLVAEPRTAMAQLEVFLRSGFTATFLDRSYLSVRIDLWSASLFQEDIAETERKLYAIYRERLVEILRRIAEEREVGAERIEKSADAIMAMLDGLWLDWQRRRNMKAIEHGICACLDLVAFYMPEAGR
ncbi:TetR family transcriptional regulator C-terminal domain-containing protein [Pseudomonas sp. GD04087]|uniref:TetR/AcrR family transcriptional regulator n=1 Tax=unclassified Pseudomonas TaxID=196821 RepID=UPI00244AEEAE|nr:MULTISPECIES: TetR family transcriptional regulator C-terminal domain-containing protein [unclassified Pseudomonas]MDH0289913.1 TetR family transcriptional regulator C-terminal domain-containing protein [Pseudomonas sp. GD04087]MDH1050188.1 TetR family transcriptional regulator C-terminal domain-containing protein [Pseudomonas sp. GD03903]MDH2002068.1 TetR family transcriptional regulator C-terminal domain-containing protein [Pseudomonas sp. GD03691]